MGKGADNDTDNWVSKYVDDDAEEGTVGLSRRAFLSRAGAGVAALGGYTDGGYGATDNGSYDIRAEETAGSAYTALNDKEWGAIYFPHDAYNAWQIWDEYDEEAIEYDMENADRLNLNAFRVLLSYEYWREHPDAFADSFDHFLDAADQYDIDVLPSLYESIGADPAHTDLSDKDIQSSFAVHSPSRSQVLQKRDWTGDNSPTAFTSWFTETYGSHDRVSAVEIMNEPGDTQPRHDFVEDMLATARDANPDAALTMGSKALEYNLNYDTPLDIYQFHLNLPPNGKMTKALDDAEEFAEEHDTPVWLTEWQRVRDICPPKDYFPDEYWTEYQEGTEPQLNRMVPYYRSLAPMLRETDKIDGAFLWGLMVKPAYIKKPRQRGRINGLLYPDGTVWNTEDARTIAGDGSLTFEERLDAPKGMEQSFL